MTSKTPTGSSSSQPDLDWSQLKETILMINIAVAQIDHSMHEGNQSVNTLANSFDLLSQVMTDIKDSLHFLPEGENKDKLASSTEIASDNISAAIVAFQFYDKLNQRLSHVSDDLTALTDLISNPSSLYSPAKWNELQATIREKYTMEEERKMFDKVLSGVSIEQALKEFNDEAKIKEQEDDIEFF